jgi:XRE family transcriptional regulator, thiamine biosynthesis regulator
MVQSFLPSMRLLVARRLRAQGLSQSRISQVLGVTQASVSLYLSTRPDRAYSTLGTLGMTEAEAERGSSALAAAALRSPVDGISALNLIWTGLLGEGSVCSAHRAASPSLANCDFCIQEYGRGRSPHAQAVSEVVDAVKLLEASPDFGRLMPEVSVNVACTAEGASTPADVVAVPGRIVKVKGRARAMFPPEAGASMHMSRVLLAVRESRPEIRACINIRYDQKTDKILREIGLKTLAIQGRPEAGAEDPTAEALKRALRKQPGSFDALIDRGGNGIEPNVYLFSRGAREVAELALEVARKYSAR